MTWFRVVHDECRIGERWHHADLGALVLVEVWHHGPPWDPEPPILIYRKEGELYDKPGHRYQPDVSDLVRIPGKLDICDTCRRNHSGDGAGI